MKFFLDTANLEEITEAVTLGVISGVTTNPSLVAKEGKISFTELLQQVTQQVSGPVSAEVIALTAPEMILEARELAKIAPNIIIKIPILPEGLKAVSVLAKEGIKTNVTLVFSAPQALMAARAGATYVSPFIGRLEDQGESGIELVADIAEIFAIHDIPTEIIAASIRNASHVTQAAKAGAHIATLPYKILQELTHHPLTDAGIERFLADWNSISSK